VGDVEAGFLHRRQHGFRRRRGWFDRGKAIVYVGTFKRESSKGIYAWQLDITSGKMEPLGLAVDTMRPVYIALHPNRRFLYAVSRPTTVDRTNMGVVLAYSIDTKTARLTNLNSFSTGGIDPAYVAVDRAGRNLLVANSPEIQLSPAWWPWVPLVPFRIEVTQ
jgi:6-phosphogluconolactonase (cycloisomerase 2 family)